MKRFRTLIITILFIGTMCYFSCGTFRQSLYSEGGNQEMIYNAITDFIHYEKSTLKKYNCFHVLVDNVDSMSKRVWVLADDENKVSLIVDIKDMSHISFITEETEMGERTITFDSLSNNPIMIVDYSKTNEVVKIWFDEEAVTKSYRAFPDEVFEWGDNIFFWWRVDGENENERHINNKVIETLYKHNYVDTSVWCSGGKIINECPRGKKYYFNERDIRIYRKKSIRCE